MSQPESDAPPKGVLIAAVVIAVVAVAAVLAVAATREPGRTPVPISAVPAPQATDPVCGSLLAAAPEALGDYHRAPTADPTPAGTAAWQPADGGEPVILRCGLERPADFVVGTPLQLVDDVEWFRVADAEGGRVSWYAVDRAVYVALTLPSGSGPDPIQEISAVLTKVAPAQPIDPAPPR